MNRRRVATFVGAGLMAGGLITACGSAVDGSSSVAETTAPGRVALQPIPMSAPTSTSSPDPWVEAVRAAKHPMAVAYGFRDDGDEAARLLLRSFERKYARCLQALGFRIEPVIDFDPETDRRNTDWINSQPLERRMAFVTARQECGDDASRRTYLAAAVGLVGDDNVPAEPERPVTNEEGRQAVITLILENRDVLEELIANLEVE